MTPILSPEQIDEFYTTGFLIVPDFFKQDEVAEMRDGFDRLQSKASQLKGITEHEGSLYVVEPAPDDRPYPVLIHRIQWVGASEPIFRRYGEDPRILQLASDILGSDDMNHLVNQVHFKLPKDGIEFPWHQDSQFRRYGTQYWNDVNGKGSFVQIATAIDAMDEGNGPLQFIPQSCKWGHLGLDKMSNLKERLGLPVNEEVNTETRLNVTYDVSEEAQQYIDPSKAVSLTLEPGDVALFGPYTIHRSLPNESDRPRRLFINGYSYPGANHRKYEGDGAGRLLSLSGKDAA